MMAVCQGGKFHDKVRCNCRLLLCGYDRTGHVCRNLRAESGGSRIEQKSDKAQRAQRKLKNQQYPWQGTQAVLGSFLYSRKVLLVGGLSVLDKYGES